MSQRRPPRAAPTGEPSRVALVSLHTSPLDQPGTGDSGGMNVYILSVARRLASQGIAVDVYSRCHGEGGPAVQGLGPGARLIRIQAGPCAPVPKEDLPRFLPQFLGGVIQHAAAENGHRPAPYDVVHSHYWLSGWVGARAKEIWGVPHVASFHTLGKVKNEAMPEGTRPEPAVRLAGEERVVRGADAILAPTPIEAEHLVRLYGADPGRIRIVPPGVDRTLFAPRPRDRARAELGLAEGRMLLFVGRLHPFKGPDVAVRTLAAALRLDPEGTADLRLVVVGGPAGHPARDPDRVEGLRQLAAEAGVLHRVAFLPPQPQDRLAAFYSAADVVLVPSRWESFGLVALEAQACGAPVVAAAVGGLRVVVGDGETGFLVPGHDPEEYARRALAILSDPALAARMSARATARAGRFSWEATAADIQSVYRELLAGGGVRR